MNVTISILPQPSIYSLALYPPRRTAHTFRYYGTINKCLIRGHISYEIVQRSPYMNINEVFLFNDFLSFQQEQGQIKNFESTRPY